MNFTITGRKWTTGEELGTLGNFKDAREAMAAAERLAAQSPTSVTLTISNGPFPLTEYDGKIESEYPS